MIKKKIIQLLIMNIDIKKQIWYYTKINLKINLLNILKNELIKMLIFFYKCFLKLIHIKIDKINKNQGDLYIINYYNQKYHKDDKLCLIKKFHKKLYLKSIVRVKIENLIKFQKKNEVQTFLIKLISIKNLYKKILRIKFKKKKKNLFIIYSTLDNSSILKKVFIHLQRTKIKKSYLIKKLYGQIINIAVHNLIFKNINHFFIYLLSFLIQI